MDEPAFAIPSRPVRRFSRETVEYEGGTLFRLAPARGAPDLVALVEAVLTTGPYDHGDWFDLPMPLYLVRDRETADTFRVAIRDGAVELHVLPDTESAGLRAFYDRLREASATTWTVSCHTDG